jgi:hypothetical protein
MRRRLTPEDRWAIVAYIRALQLSQNAKQAMLQRAQHVEPLHEIAKSVKAASLALPIHWGLPATAVYGTPNNQDNVFPAADGDRFRNTAPAAAAEASEDNSTSTATAVAEAKRQQ